MDLIDTALPSVPLFHSGAFEWMAVDADGVVRSSLLMETQGGQEYMEEMRGMVQDTLFNPLEKPLPKVHYCSSFPILAIRREAVRREWQIAMGWA